MTLDKANLVKQLSEIVGHECVLTEEADCLTYGYDNSRRTVAPEIVLFPTKAEQLSDIVKVCYQNNTPIVARGRATATTGATVPIKKGVVISFERLSKIKKIDTDNRLVVVEPGVINQDLQDALKEKGFFWPPDPTSAAYCTIGGNISCNSAGPKAVKYGTPRENILGLKAVIGDGTEITTGTKTTKGVVGYDLTRLITGSEGTLAIISEATLKITPLQESKITIQAIYKTVEDSAKAVASIMAQPITPCALEFIDNNAIDMIRDYSDAEIPENAGALLMIEIDGSDIQLKEDLPKIISSAKNAGTISITPATTEKEITELWKTRKALSPALRKVAPKKINEDVVVPVSNIPVLISGLDKLSQKYQIKIVNFGHAGNGNIHVNLLTDPDDKEKLAKAEKCLDEVFNLVLELNGTISGEHGIGIEKQNHITKEIEQKTMNLMKNIKKQFDPKNILNPGKIFPDQ